MGSSRAAADSKAASCSLPRLPQAGGPRTGRRGHGRHSLRPVARIHVPVVAQGAWEGEQHKAFYPAEGVWWRVHCFFAFTCFVPAGCVSTGASQKRTISVQMFRAGPRREAEVFRLLFRAPRVNTSTGQIKDRRGSVSRGRLPPTRRSPRRWRPPPTVGWHCRSAARWSPVVRRIAWARRCRVVFIAGWHG